MTNAITEAKSIEEVAAIINAATNFNFNQALENALERSKT